MQRRENMTDIITCCLILAILSLIIAYPLRFLWKYLHRFFLSLIVIILTNIIGHSFGFIIGVNIITVLFCAILGVPGYTTLILLKLLL